MRYIRLTDSQLITIYRIFCRRHAVLPPRRRRATAEGHVCAAAYATAMMRHYGLHTAAKWAAAAESYWEPFPSPPKHLEGWRPPGSGRPFARDRGGCLGRAMLVAAEVANEAQQAELFQAARESWGQEVQAARRWAATHYWFIRWMDELTWWYHVAILRGAAGVAAHLRTAASNAVLLMELAPAETAEPEPAGECA